MKPELSYAARLPKDYFRSPVCAGAFDAVERTKVPYHALLGHLQNLDMEDGIADGESAALSAIQARRAKLTSPNRTHTRTTTHPQLQPQLMSPAHRWSPKAWHPDRCARAPPAGHD